jgi:PAS domain S-box-containing protein
MERAERFSASLSEDGRYRLLVEAITDYAIYMLDPDGVVTSWNAGAQRFKGYEASDILGQHFSRFYTEEDRQAGLPDRALEVAARESKFESEGWRVRKDGSRFWAHVVIDPIRTTSGEIVGFAKITRDLTERKLAEEVLRRSEEQFRRLVQGVADYAIFMLDTEGRVATWNSGARRIKGYDPDEIIGEHFSRFYTEEDRKAGEPQRGLDIAARDGRFEKEGWRVRKDGTHFLANVVIDAIRDDDGALVGFAKITRDVTEQRAAQRAIAEARESLFQAQKLEAMGQLTGGIAHDFNNLLMAVLGSLEPLRKRLPDDPKIRSLLDNAVEGARRGVSLTKRLLAFARRQELKLEPIDVPTLVRGMTDLLKRSLGPSIVIETRFHLGLPRVQADANQLEAALLNLAVNARDAMPEGGFITIAAQEENVAPGHDTNLTPGRYVRLSVSDTGEGMDEATLARATEPFFTTKGVGKGTGLGLPMVHGLTEQSGGRLILKSRKGAGTTVELWLPLSVEDLEPSAHDDPQPAAQRSQRSTRPLIVLAVDDDILVLMGTTAMLEDLGHTVIEAVSGRQAVDILRREQTVDLVITDQAMPQMTGIQLVGAIRVEWPDLPIILATGYAELPPGTVPDIPKLTKPFQEHDLAEIIADVIQPKPVTGRVPDDRAR